MKKILLLLLALVTVFALAACELDRNPADMTGDANGGPSTMLGGGTYVQDEQYPHSGTVEGGNYPKGDEPVSWFDAEVLSVHGGTILVAAHEESWVKHRCAAELYVSTKLYSGEQLTGFETGDMVRITYNGMIAESYPAQIFTVYNIEWVR